MEKGNVSNFHFFCGKDEDLNSFTDAFFVIIGFWDYFFVYLRIFFEDFIKHLY